jgi:FtsP/CotA-like multicopper oxidase with cupredoxin domain
MRWIGRVLAVLAVVLSVSPGRAAEPRVIDLTITAGALPSSQRVLRIQQGDDLVVRWTADAPVTVHLHGYDIELQVGPGAPARMQFRARATGRFPITVHGQSRGQEATLGYLEVHPR